MAQQGPTRSDFRSLGDHLGRHRDFGPALCALHCFNVRRFSKISRIRKKKKKKNLTMERIAAYQHCGTSHLYDVMCSEARSAGFPLCLPRPSRGIPADVCSSLQHLIGDVAQPATSPPIRDLIIVRLGSMQDSCHPHCLTCSRDSRDLLGAILIANRISRATVTCRAMIVPWLAMTGG